VGKRVGTPEYRLRDYGRMITDQVRMQAYHAALQQRLQPGATVLDLGTGVGIFAFLACQMGAKQVFGIEPDPVIRIAEEIAIANGFANQMTWIQDFSTQVDLPTPVDVIISDLRGILPLYGHHIPAIIDARERFLKPGGSLIPQQDSLWAAVVEIPQLYQQYAKPWIDQFYGLDLQAGLRFACNQWHSDYISPQKFLVEPQCWATLDYHHITSPDVCSEMHWVVQQPGIAHGLKVWFDTLLAPGVGFTNRPDVAEAAEIYGSAFLPWSQPVALNVGDQIYIALDARLRGEDYLWCWRTEIYESSYPDAPKVSFKQSTFLGTPLSAADILAVRSQPADSVPSPPADA
jgi:type I protein arginine methyltransferase